MASRKTLFTAMSPFCAGLRIVTLNPLLTAPIRDANDLMVVQTAIIGEADIICTNDEDFSPHPSLNT